MAKVGRETNNRIKVKKQRSTAVKTAAADPIPSGENVYQGYSGQLLVGGYVATVQQAKYAYSHHLAAKPPRTRQPSHRVAKAAKAKSTGHTSTGSTHHAAPHPIKVISTPPSLGTSSLKHRRAPDTLTMSGRVF